MRLRRHKQQMLWPNAAAVVLGGFVWLLAGCGSGVNGVNVPSTPSLPVAAVQSGPQLGYLWSASDSTLRPLLGVPGAAQVGEPITTAGAYVFGAASVRSALALLQSANGGLSVMALPQGSPVAISGATVQGTAQIVFSPSGDDAVAYSSGGSSALLLTGLNATPQVQTLSSPGSLLSATVSDAGDVAAVYDSDPLTVAMLTGNHVSITSLSGFGGFAFLGGGSDLLVADRTANTITIFRKAATAPAAQTFTSNAIKAPVAVMGSVDGLWAVVANSADTSVVKIDLTGTTPPQRIACGCQPTQLTSLAGDAVFSLTAPGTAASWVVDASAATPRTVFIPAMVHP